MAANGTYLAVKRGWLVVAVAALWRRASSRMLWWGLRGGCGCVDGAGSGADVLGRSEVEALMKWRLDLGAIWAEGKREKAAILGRGWWGVRSEWWCSFTTCFNFNNNIKMLG